MAKETGYLPKLVRDKKEDYSLKTEEERLEDFQRLEVICRLQPRRDYWEYRPRVIEEFEEEQARIRAEKGILGELIESNTVLRCFFWPWRDSPKIDDAEPEPPSRRRKPIRERFCEIWNRTKEYFSMSRDKLCKAWSHTKEVVYCYWERGTNGWYFEQTPVEWATPLFHTWPIAAHDVYWFPDTYFSNQPRDFNGPFAIGPWPVCDPIPRIPYECEIRCAVLRKWEQYKSWRNGSTCSCGDPSCEDYHPDKCERVPAIAREESSKQEEDEASRRRWAEQQRQATEDDSGGRGGEGGGGGTIGSEPSKKRRYNCDEMCKRD